MANLKNPVEIRFQAMSQILRLSEVERHFLAFLIVIDNSVISRRFFDTELDIFLKSNRHLLLRALGCDKKELDAVLSGRLKKLGFIFLQENLAPDLDASFFQFLTYGKEPLEQSFLVPVANSILTEKDFRLDGQTLETLKKFLKGVSNRATHILIYGPKGVGKTQLARFLATEASRKAYEVYPGERLRQFRDNLLLSYGFLATVQGSVLIVDQADGLLSSPLAGWGTEDAEDIDDSLEPEKGFFQELVMNKNGPPCLWIVNETEGIQDEILDRFVLGIKLNKLGTKERLEIWRREEAERGANFLQDQTLRYLAKEFAVSPLAISRFGQKTWEIEPQNPQKAELWLKKQLRANLELHGQGTRPLKIGPTYRPLALTTNPPAAQLLANLIAWRDRSLLSESEDRIGQKLLFYGPPGAGKTELANYLAEELDLDFSVIRSSDIISPYRGQSEANLAALFRKYENSLGIILIDEVESFLYNRDLAAQSSELSLANEFFACLDHFTGLFIGTTNQPESLDKAAWRRLGRKVEFGALSEFGQIELFEAYFKPITGQALTKDEKERLKLLRGLRPSDFATLADNLNNFAPKSLCNLAILEALKEIMEKMIMEKEIVEKGANLQ
ncbi:MAG: AAA family ATPase [Deltaproteobacteria bacterium]|nr:AAA family ATPase [Deltaproteobacteria bacterium]